MPQIKMDSIPTKIRSIRVQFGRDSDYSIMIGEKKENLIPRPPVVVILGHVDHGKSSILEAIKDLKITEKESGGITQHIGAYEIEHPSTSSGQAKKITFIDTPGHEAFSAMRSRGAKVADIAVLVVAANEGVKSQTKEAISHIKISKLPFVVALNKIDDPKADPEKTKRELVKEHVLVESLGGKVPSVEISAKTKQNIEELLALILLLAEMEDLKGNIHKKAEVVVIEAYVDSKRGPTATLLLRDGVLEKGDILGTPSTFGKMKILEDSQRNQIEKAFPSMPVVALGFEKVPRIGEKFEIFPDLETAKTKIKEGVGKTAERQIFVGEPKKKVLNLILKTDVLGSLEVITELFQKLPQEKIGLRVLKEEVGDILETDVKLAKPARAKIIGFRVKTSPIVKTIAEKEGVRILNYGIIYDLAQGVRELMEKTLEPETERKELGKIKTLLIFRKEKNRQIIGGKVMEGKVKKGALVEILRNEEMIGRGKLINLQREKKDVEECNVRDECGILYEGSEPIAEGDILIFYTEERIKREL